MAQHYSNQISRHTAAAETTPPHHEERILLQRLAHGDAAAFWELWERYRAPLLYPYCLQWMQGNRADAEDVLSSASLKAWKGLTDSAHQITNPKAWLLRLLHNLCLDIHKAHDRSHTVPHVDLSSGGRPAGPVQESVETAALRREMSCHIQRAIDALPPQLREPSLLYLMHGMPPRDIAAYLNLGPDRIRKRLQQARTMLQKRLTVYLAGRPGAPAGEAEQRHSHASPRQPGTAALAP